MAITFSRQTDVGLCYEHTTQYWENLIPVVVLVSESKALYYCLNIKILHRW